MNERPSAPREDVSLIAGPGGWEERASRSQPLTGEDWMHEALKLRAELAALREGWIDGECVDVWFDTPLTRTGSVVLCTKQLGIGTRVLVKRKDAEP